MIEIMRCVPDLNNIVALEVKYWSEVDNIFNALMLMCLRVVIVDIMMEH